MSADACCERAVVVAERESSNASCETTVTPVAGVLAGPFSSSTQAPSTAPALPGPYYSTSPSFMTQALQPKLAKQPRSPREQVSPKRARTGGEAHEDGPDAQVPPARKGAAGAPSPSPALLGAALQQQLGASSEEAQQQEDGAVFSPVFHCLGLRTSLESEAGVALPDALAPGGALGSAAAATAQQPQPLGLGIPGVGAISCVAPATRPVQRWGDKQSPRYQHHHPSGAARAGDPATGAPGLGAFPPPHHHQHDAQEHDQGQRQLGDEQPPLCEEEDMDQQDATDNSSCDVPLDVLPPVLQLSLPPSVAAAPAPAPRHPVLVHALPHPHEHPNHPIIPEAAEHELPPPPASLDVDVADQDQAAAAAPSLVGQSDPDAMAVVAAAPGTGQHDEVDQQQQQQQEEEQDYMDFDPLLFIKLLPPLEEVVPKHRAPLLPRKTRHCKPKTLVLDLDETLVHSCLEAHALADFTFPVHFNSHEHIIHVRQRPHLHTFLERMAELYEVVVFTASQKIYAEKLLNIIDPERRLVKHRIFRESCVVVDGNYLKDLSVLGRDLRTTLIVDNSPQAFGFQVDNGVPIESWFDDPADQELLKLLPFLEQLVHADDVRPAIRSKFRMRELIDRVVC